MELTIQRFAEQPGQKSARIAVGGRLDSLTYRELERFLEPYYGGKYQNLILDLKDLHFISSAGVRVLMTASSELEKNNGKLLIANMQPQITKVLEIIKALPGISVFASAQEMDDYLAAIQKKVIEENE